MPAVTAAPKISRQKLPILTKLTLVGEATDADLIWPSIDDLKTMDLQQGKVKISRITVYYDTSLTAIQLKLTNGTESPLLSNYTAEEVGSHQKLTLDLDQTKAIDKVTVNYSPV